MFKKLGNFNTGFTLIELLVSISIVGLIFGIVITSSAAIQKNSRNTRRQADLQIIQGALQQYYADQFVYPNADFDLTSSLTGITGDPPVPSAGKTYLQTVPQDPQSSNKQYCYKPLDSSNNACENSNTDFKRRCNKYLLYANLEDGTGSFSCGTYSSYDLEITSNN